MDLSRELGSTHIEDRRKPKKPKRIFKPDTLSELCKAGKHTSCMGFVQVTPWQVKIDVVNWCNCKCHPWNGEKS